MTLKNWRETAIHKLNSVPLYVAPTVMNLQMLLSLLFLFVVKGFSFTQKLLTSAEMISLCNLRFFMHQAMFPPFTYPEAKLMPHCLFSCVGK